MRLDIDIKNVRNIRHASLSLPLEKGIYTLVGENGCGKSTLMLIMSLIVKTSSAHMLTLDDIDETSLIDIETEDGKDLWYYKNGKMTTGKFTTVRRSRTTKQSHSALVVSTHWPGFYEGSIFYGTRFDDYDKVDELLTSSELQDDLVQADSFVSETLGYILHNDKRHYDNLFRIKNRRVAEKFKLKGMPYFMTCKKGFISQFKMSSGECMLISLIDFINTLIIKGTRFNKFLFLIDEVELALHPSAIDRLVLFIQKLLENSERELVFYFSTHSAELLQRIEAKKIFLVENIGGNIEITNPCYPNYAIRSLYIPNGFDFLILVEDELTKAIVEKVIRENNLSKSKLCCVLPAGGCNQMLKLHSDIVTYNALGVGKKVISVFDGDVKSQIVQRKEFKNLPKCFLPIPSIEKYLYKKLIEENDRVFTKMIGDKYFCQRTLSEIILDYKNDPRTTSRSKENKKDLYRVLISNLEKNGISEEEFIKYLCDDIFNYEKPEKFVASLTTLLS